MESDSNAPGTKGNCTPRVQRLYARLWQRMLEKQPWWGQGLSVLGDEGALGRPLVVRKALAIRKVLAAMPVELDPEELIVGVMPMGSMGCGYLFPEYATREETKAAAQRSLSIFSVYGHSVPDYARVLEKGMLGIRAEVLAREAGIMGDDPEASEQRAFLQAAAISCDAVISLAERYADLAAQMAEQPEHQPHREELLSIARVCRRVPAHPARSFREALQGFWFVFMSLHSTLTVAPVGRFDYFAYPFLKRELDEGFISLPQAQELVDCLWIKFNQRTQYLADDREYHPDPYQLNTGVDPNDGPVRIEQDDAYDNHWLQHMALGGQTPEGEDSTNELTYLALQTLSRFDLTQPTVSVRLSPDVPEGLLRRCCEVIRGGGGMPALFNDRAIVQALHGSGYPLEEARGYSPDGCWEPLIPGKTEFCWGPIHGLKALEYLFTRGTDRVSGRREAPDTGDPGGFGDFRQFLEAYQAQLDHQVRGAVDSFVANWRASYQIAPDPLLSCLIEGCIESARDLTNGGARYSYYPLYLSGLAHVADSLAAVKRLVFEQHLITMDQLAEALDRDYQGFEVLRQLLLTRAPKYGNGNPQVDGLAREVADFFIASVARHGSGHPPILFSAGIGAIGGLYLPFGRLVGATPDGRPPGDPLAPGATPAVGRDLSGPTAAVHSYAGLGFARIPGGGPLDLGMEPRALAGEEGLGRMVAFVRGFLELGGCILTVTVTDVETLRQAQLEPEKHRGLRVRMGGWQAYFVNLNRDHQEHHISRVKHSLR